MNKIILATAALASMAFFAACDSCNPSTAQQPNTITHCEGTTSVGGVCRNTKPA